MGQPLGFEAGSFVDKFRKHILGMLVRVASQRRQRFQLTYCFQPDPERWSETSTPALGCKNKLQPIKDHGIENAHEKVVRRFEILHSAIEFGDSLRGENSRLLELSLQLQQSGTGEGLALKCS